MGEVIKQWRNLSELFREQPIDRGCSCSNSRGFATSNNCFSEILADESLHHWLQVSLRLHFFQLQLTFNSLSGSGVLHGGQTFVSFTAWSPWGVSRPPGTHSCECHRLRSRCHPARPLPVSSLPISASPFRLFTQPATPLASGNSRLILCIWVCVVFYSVWNLWIHFQNMKKGIQHKKCHSESQSHPKKWKCWKLALKLL